MIGPELALVQELASEERLPEQAARLSVEELGLLVLAAPSAGPRVETSVAQFVRAAGSVHRSYPAELALGELKGEPKVDSTGFQTVVLIPASLYIRLCLNELYNTRLDCEKSNCHLVFLIGIVTCNQETR